MTTSWSIVLQARLGITKGTRLGLANASPVFIDSLGELPAGARILSVSEGNLDVVVYFSTDHSGIATALSALLPYLAPSGAFWIAWPIKVPGVPLTLVEDQARELGLAAGLVDTRVSAIDDTWTGLRFVRKTS